ncbi:hypothetical protein [Clostridium peptidivorans]|nr:hypothetical protein [Clostridium peptidivorans]
MFQPNNGYDIIIENNSKPLIKGVDLAKTLNDNITIKYIVNLKKENL